MSIVLENLAVGYSESNLLIEGAEGTLGPGIHILVGPNGSGKTALLRTIAGLLKPLRGRVLVGGVETAKASRREVAKLVGLTWQNPYYGFVEPTVEDEIKFILRQTGVKGDWSIVEALVPGYLLKRDPFSLSGGEAKRVGIASVLVADQPVWLLDEPFEGLDLEGVRAVMGLIELGRKRGKSVVVAVHTPAMLDLLKPDTVLAIDARARKLLVLDSLDDGALEALGVVSRRFICR